MNSVLNHRFGDNLAGRWQLDPRRSNVAFRTVRSADFFDIANHGTVRFVSDSAVPQGDVLKVRGRLCARDQSIPLELDAKVRVLDWELAVEASISALHRELGMTWSPLGMISARSELVVTGYLMPTT